ncbi:MAG: prepilin-type N-terminal cleavage/methylation domain-containing protein [Armatimonadota bacterium]|jgi:prepilin-type N-terminal cleavage/methylation domain-containing protein
MTRRGFSMVEMVGVIAVIAILAAILFPAFAKCREQARANSCRTNLLNIGMALRLYSADHNGWYPPTDDDLLPLLPRCLADEGVFGCPSYSEQVPILVAPDGNGAEETLIHLSYYYRAGRKHNQSPRAPVVAEYKASHNDRAHVLFSDGDIASLPEAAWRGFGFRPIDEPVEGAPAPIDEAEEEQED